MRRGGEVVGGGDGEGRMIKHQAIAQETIKNSISVTATLSLEIYSSLSCFYFHIITIFTTIENKKA